jgi:hypothetical protein
MYNYGNRGMKEKDICYPKEKLFSCGALRSVETLSTAALAKAGVDEAPRS